MSETRSISIGPDALGWIGIVFVTLKLCGIIDWSWWWVTAPFWGGFAIMLTIVVLVVLTSISAVVMAVLIERITARGE